jgi:hypothetical protein
MGYRDDPFFNITWEGDAAAAGGRMGGKVNPGFLFPDKSVRFLDAQSELQRRFNKGVDTLANGSYKIHRGYIRNLEQPNIGNIPISKCHFQFNPQEIRQNVAMREDMYVPLLQDIHQLGQPVGAVVNFTYDLMFDRSHEVSKGKKPLSGTSWMEGTPEADLETIGADDAYDIGVLADLRVLYSVIGQGFSKEMLEFQKKRYNNKLTVENNKLVNQYNKSLESDPDGTDLVKPSLAEIDQGELDELLSANYGNFGLLMPNPVRVMFSSLFMLDGFVTGTNVDFLKFNSNMVPLMCRVTMNMQAMYIGFAKEKTFLVDTFLASADAIAENEAKQAAEVAEVITALNRTAKQFIIAGAFDNTRSTDVSWDAAANDIGSSIYNLYMWQLAVSDGAAREADPNGGFDVRTLYLGFPQIKPVKGGDVYKYVEGDKVQTREGADRDAILTLLELGSGLSVSYSWSINVYGGKTEATALSEYSAGVYAKGNYRSDLTHLGSYSGSETASSKAEWGAGTSGDGAAAERVRRRSIRGSLPNTAEGRYYAEDSNDVPNWFKDAFYVVEVEMTLEASVNGESVASTTKRSVKALNRHLYNKFIINWSAPGTGNDYSIDTRDDALDPR